MWMRVATKCFKKADDMIRFTMNSLLSGTLILTLSDERKRKVKFGTKLQSHVSQASVLFIIEESPPICIRRQSPRLYFFQITKTCKCGRGKSLPVHICKN